MSCGATLRSLSRRITTWCSRRRSTSTRRTSAGSAGLAHFLAAAAAAAGLAVRLRDQGVERAQLPMLAADAMKQWTGGFNPVELTAEDYEALYESAF